MGMEGYSQGVRDAHEGWMLMGMEGYSQVWRDTHRE